MGTSGMGLLIIGSAILSPLSGWFFCLMCASSDNLSKEARSVFKALAYGFAWLAGAVVAILAIVAIVMLRTY